MDTYVQLARSIVTVAALLTFVGIIIWAWSASRRERFEAAARLPLEQDDVAQEANAPGAEPAGRGSMR